MNVVYVLIYDIELNNFDISGVYSTLELAQAAVQGVSEWKKHQDLALWEGFDANGKLWCIEAHGLQ